MKKHIVLLSLLTAFTLSINTVFSQSVFRLQLPYVKFGGENIGDNPTSETGFPVYNFWASCYHMQTHIPIVDQRLDFFIENGFSVFGANQYFDCISDYEKYKLYGIYLGLYFQYNILKKGFTPFVYAGCDQSYIFNTVMYAYHEVTENGYFFEVERRTIGHWMFLPDVAGGVGFLLPNRRIGIDFRLTYGFLGLSDTWRETKPMMYSLGLIFQLEPNEDN
jgi:hypothetical protein